MNCSKNLVAMDKVCIKCGSVGYAKDIVTCFTCKRISEHTYCMQKLRRAVPAIWHCEDCIAKSNEKLKKRQTILLEGKHVPGDAAPVRSCLLNRGPSKQLNGSVKQHPGMIRTTTNSRVIPNVPVFPASKASEARSQGVHRATTASVQHALSKFAREAGFHEKKGNDHEHKPSGKKVSGAFCNKEPLKKTVGPRSHHSPLNDIRVSKSNCATVLRCQSNVEERKMVTARTLERNMTFLEKEGHKALVKKNPLEGCCRAEFHSNATGLGSKANHDAGISKPYVGQGQSTQTTNIGPSAMHNETAKVLSTVGFFGNSDSRFEKHGRQNTDFPRKSVLTLDGMHRHHPIPCACWKGNFKILDMFSTIGPEIQGIQAHTPDVVSSKVHEIVKEFSGKVEIELRPRVDLWPKPFRLDPPDLDDIGLYFFPSREQRLKETFKCFVDMVDKQGLAMQSRLQNAELLIFTSAQLTQDPYVMGVVPEVFLWGVFCRIRPQRQTTTNKIKRPFNSPTTPGNANSGQNNSGSSFQLRAEGMIIAITNRPDGPPGFSEAVSANQSQRGRQAVTSTPVIDSRAADLPPGFSGPIYRPKRR